MQNIVYRLIFSERKQNNIFPYYYIGVKSNCQIVNGKIIDQNGKEYWGSCKSKDYKEILQNNQGSIEVELLSSRSQYRDALDDELFHHIENDVVMSPEYFNCHISSQNTFHDPNYSSMKNVTSGKICRINLNHPDVASGLWVGTTKGTHWYNDGVQSKTFPEDCQPEGWLQGRIPYSFGADTPFFGRKHSAESKQKISDSRRKIAHPPVNKGITGAVKYINNGVKTKTILIDEDVPYGWVLGKPKTFRVFNPDGSPFTQEQLKERERQSWKRFREKENKLKSYTKLLQLICEAHDPFFIFWYS